MFIEKIVSETRVHFFARYKCESCGFCENGIGYLDKKYVQDIVPKLVCKRCGLSTIELKILEQQE